jgi:hypothetical protein
MFFEISTFETLCLLTIIAVLGFVLLAYNMQACANRFAKHKDETKLTTELSHYTLKYGIISALLSMYLLVAWGRWSDQQQILPEDEGTVECNIHCQ